MLNNTILMGRIVHTPELKTTQAGKDFLKFTLAINRNKEEADFIDCLAWEKTANMIYNYFNKGSLVAVEGNIRTGTYTGKDGTNKKRFEVWVNRIHFTGEKKKETEEIPEFESEEDLPF